MKPVKREWMLIAAFVLFWVYIVSQQAFMLGTLVELQKMRQIFVSHAAGMLLGGFLLPLLLPLRVVREKPNQRFVNIPAHRKFRLAIVGAFFLPNIIVHLQGQQAWMASSFNTVFMAVCNGVVTTLFFGCFINLSGEKGVLWRTIIYSIGYIWHNLVLGPGRDILLPLMFASAGFLLTGAGVLILVFLAGTEPSFKDTSLKDTSLRDADSSGEVSSNPPLLNTQINAKKFDLRYILPVLAALVIFWTNSITDRLFFPMLNIHFPPGFHLTTLVLILVLPVLGFLAYRWWRQFRIVFVPVSSFLFLFIPSLLLFNRSAPLFLVLYTLNLIMVQIMIQLFPFIITDLYWQRPNVSGYRAGGYWAYLLAASLHIIHANAFILVGPFRRLSLDNAHTVMLLSLAAVAYYFLSRMSIDSMSAAENAARSAVNSAAAPAAIPAKSLEDSFKEHGLSEREAEVALLMAREGLSAKEMGERLFISPLTVRDHTSSVYRKFGVKGRAEFMAKIFKNK